MANQQRRFRQYRGKGPKPVNHCAQNQDPRAKYEFSHWVEDYPDREEYKERGGLKPSVCHHGQRKLYLSELFFLTQFATPNCRVVYVGAGPGQHIAILADLFPNVEFHLFDDHFDPSLKACPNIHLYERYFTAQDADTLASGGEADPLLFISDIRTIGDDGDRDHIELGIQKDMDDQLEWYTRIRAAHGMLKCRFPWKVPYVMEDGREVPLNKHRQRLPVVREEWVTRGGQVCEYAKGRMFIQPFQQWSSTEIRLILSGPPVLVGYDNLDVEQFYYPFNKKIRPSRFGRTVDHPLVDQCYDCVAQSRIINVYLMKFGTQNAKKGIFRKNFGPMAKEADIRGAELELLGRMFETIGSFTRRKD
jgi:hypothetical protein